MGWSAGKPRPAARDRLPAPQAAALLNASMGQALDLDDTLDTGGSIHPGVSVLGAVLTVYDALESVTGRDVPSVVIATWTGYKKAGFS